MPFGQADVRRAGGDVTIVATGWTVGKALEAAESLAAEGIEAEVIDPRTIAAARSRDDPQLGRRRPAGSCSSTRRRATARPPALIAADVAEHGFSSLKAPIKQVTALDATIPYSEPMEAYVLPDEVEDRERRAPGARLRRGRRPEPPCPRSTPASALALLETMCRIRCFEERVAQLKRVAAGPRADPPEHRRRGRRRRGLLASCATTTPSTRATARTGTRSPRARRWTG